MFDMGWDHRALEKRLLIIVYRGGLPDRFIVRGDVKVLQIKHLMMMDSLGLELRTYH